MSGELLALRTALVAAHEDAIFAAHLSVKQLLAREQEPGTRAVLAAMVEVLDSAYSESVAA